MSPARYLFGHADETAAALLAVAKAHPGLVGFNLDLEAAGAATEQDMQAFTGPLGSVTRTLNAAPGGPIRF